MSDYDWLNDYTSDSISGQGFYTQTAPEPKAKRKKGSSKKPWLPKFPPIENIVVMRVQFFDNGPNPGKGHAQHTLKFRVYLENGRALNQRDPDWYRVVQLIEPKKVLTWAENEHNSGKLTEESLARYKGVADTLKAVMENDPDIAWAKMGHIGSPPGTHYFHNQFVACWCRTSGEMSAMLYLEDGSIGIDPFYPNKRSRKEGAPKSHALYDPHGRIIPQEGDDDEL